MPPGRRRRHEWVEGAPRPGDTADDGPRPAATWRDVAWAVFLGVTLLLGVGMAVLLLSWVAFSGDVEVTTGLAIVGFLFTVAGAMIVFWLTLGAWRRTVWGCPFAHEADAPWVSRCQRHALLGDAPSEQRDPSTASDPPTRP